MSPHTQLDAPNNHSHTTQPRLFGPMGETPRTPLNRPGARIPLALAITALGLPLLTGCFGSPLGGTIGDKFQQAVGGARDGDVSVGELPGGWPAEVEVIDGDIQFGVGGAYDGENEEGWAVTIASDATDPIAEAQAVLESAEFIVDNSRSRADSADTVALTNANYLVLVAGDDNGLLYTVTPVQ